MFFHAPSESEEGEESREGSESIGTKIDYLEEAIETEVRASFTTSIFMKCFVGVLKALIKWYIWVRNKEHTD